ncbi:MAG: response regulator [Deltaproteobacteria bacterium]|nr:response regulator [Deltaproteobacteria bacterium]
MTNSSAEHIEHMLIVDDSLEDREVYKRMFSRNARCTYRLVEAETVAEAMTAFREQRPDCILLDYQLPDGDGLELLEELAAENDELPAVVFLTGQGSEEVAVRALKHGAQDYLVKNKLLPETLCLTVHSAIERVDLQRTIRQQQEEKDQLIVELKDALTQIKKLGGMLPICTNCKSIRDDSGYWQRVEHYIATHSEANFSHSICPECITKIYPELADEILKK